MFSLILLFAGKSTRANTNKSLSKVKNKYYYEQILSLLVTKKEFKQIIIVCSKENYENFRIEDKFSKLVTKIYGSDSRQESVWEALKIVNQKFCLIHDGARPLLNSRVLEEVCESLISGKEAVVPIVRISDMVVDNGYGTVATGDLIAVQTPQGFLCSSIIHAYNININNISSFRDDSSIYFRCYGKKPHFVDGSILNQKVTFFKDVQDLADEI
jgi:2-C-methyl-D-erythritol 4-phosphate cytidylyltransferase